MLQRVTKNHYGYVFPEKLPALVQGEGSVVLMTKLCHSVSLWNLPWTTTAANAVSDDEVLCAWGGRLQQGSSQRYFFTVHVPREEGCWDAENSIHTRPETWVSRKSAIFCRK